MRPETLLSSTAAANGYLTRAYSRPSRVLPRAMAMSIVPAGVSRRAVDAVARRSSLVACRRSYATRNPIGCPRDAGICRWWRCWGGSSLAARHLAFFGTCSRRPYVHVMRPDRGHLSTRRRSILIDLTQHLQSGVGSVTNRCFGCYIDTLALIDCPGRNLGFLSVSLA